MNSNDKENEDGAFLCTFPMSASMGLPDVAA